MKVTYVPLLCNLKFMDLNLMDNYNDSLFSKSLKHRIYTSRRLTVRSRSTATLLPYIPAHSMSFIIRSLYKFI